MLSWRKVISTTTLFPLLLMNLISSLAPTLYRPYVLMILTIWKLHLLYTISLFSQSLLWVIFRINLTLSLSKHRNSLFSCISFLFRYLLVNFTGAGHCFPLPSDIFLSPLCFLCIPVVVLLIIVLLQLEQWSFTLNLIMFTISRHMLLVSFIMNYFRCYSRTLNS